MTKAPPLRAPFPWPGSKRSVASLIWDRFGPVANYVEPFAGSLAVLLARPPDMMGGHETVCDTDGLLINFYRAVRWAPGEVARYADWPTSQIDLTARRAWLRDAAQSIRAHLEADPDWYDAKAAAWWAWCVCVSVGPFKLRQRGRPHLGRPSGLMSCRHELPSLFTSLANRLAETRILCCDWQDVLTPAATTFHRGITGVFLDPPYSSARRAMGLYQCDSATVAMRVQEWARAHGANPKMRICLAGFDGDYDLPGWDCVEWRSRGGYGRYVRGGPSRAMANRGTERLWFSPWCLSGTKAETIGGIDGRLEDRKDKGR